MKKKQHCFNSGPIQFLFVSALVLYFYGEYYKRQLHCHKKLGYTSVMVVSTTQYGEPEMFWSVSGSHTEVLILDKILWKILGQGFHIFNIFFKDRYLSLSAIGNI